ncbi:3-deoxy-D-manno-octulosonic acid transferase [Pseudoduganella sp. FT25W]|uniref:3-deoxy-D-manno-octulosonic acid transferase n=1 Tax=Duganella alba TaxID=2666081 RepID=A0A6L5QJW4_9BURK|nr:lipid IV(A) 3-deoxy-D-manno-octulosonic acid transferase [Duganella alba]MRX09965.1 3-deoxy-D-manno-octulosonic acid transferase [Duganella alba]MRX17840.1 3-deoxy-D-manno-octulosonic acid transferase [Duganella alba]
MRLFYSLMWWLALPLVLTRLWLRGRKEPGYRQHWGERLGFYGRADGSAAAPVLWVHAVSVGETRAAEPLVDALLAEYPQSRIILTHMTPTGRATGRALFAKHGARLVQSYLPYDTGSMVSRFIRHFQPGVCILMETEVWPNLIAVCGAKGVPVVLANARLSERSLRKATRFGSLLTDAARGIALVAAQTEADAQRVRSLGVQRVEVTGSIKFDVVVPDAALAIGIALRAAIGERPVLLCASTREGEEELILQAFMSARTTLPADLLLLIVPRHPQRFDEVENMIAARGLTVERRSRLALDGGAMPGSVAVLLGDSMGEMFAYYSACDIAFVGGSLLPLGGQNLIEPAALGKPVLIGQHTFNFELVTEDALAAGGAQRVTDAAGLMSATASLLGDTATRATMGHNALAFANQHRGATRRTLALLPSLF